jgi:hypothetical protein
MLVKRLGEAERKESFTTPKRKTRPVTLYTPQKNRSKATAGVSLDEMLAAHAADRASEARHFSPRPRDETSRGVRATTRRRSTWPAIH